MSPFRDALRAVLPAVRSTVREGGGASLVSQEQLQGRPDLVRRAITSLPNTSDLFPTRETFIAVAYALRAAFGSNLIGEARDAFHEWAGRWKDGLNDPGFTDAEFDRCKGPYRRGASWLYELAEQHGGGSFTRAAQWFEAPAADSLFPSEPAAEAPARLRFMSFAEAVEGAHAVSGRPLVKGLLDQGTMSVVYGDSNAGKTFAVLTICHHVATGKPWLGRAVACFKVAYVAAEGGSGIRRRFAALNMRLGEAAALHLLASPIDLYSPTGDLQPLIGAIRDLQSDGGVVGLVVIDTLARTMVGGDENSSRDMSQFVRHADLIRKSTGAHVLIVHHSGKDASKGARGSSVLRAATDTEIEVAKNGNGGTFSVTKQRDLDGDLTIAFQFEVVELGRDQEGEISTSCVVRFSQATDAPSSEGLKGFAAEIFEAVADLAPGPGSKGATVAEVVAYLVNSGCVANSESVRSNLRRLEKTRNVLVKTGAGRWALRRPIRKKNAEEHFDFSAIDPILG